MSYSNADTQATGAAQRLSFPADRSLGRLYIDDDAVGERFLCDAQGVVHVPSGHAVTLKVASEACADLSSLKTMPSAAFESIIFEGAEVPSKQLSALSGLTQLRRLILKHCEVQSRQFLALDRLHALRDVAVSWCPVGNTILHWLSQLPAIEQLDLSRTLIDDSEFGLLSRMHSLKRVSIAGTKLTDAALQVLAPMQNIEWLQVTDSHVSERAIESFRKQRPNVTVVL